MKTFPSKKARLDYPRLDSQIDFYYKDDLTKCLHCLTFLFVSEAVATLYYEEGLSCAQIAPYLGTTKYTVNRWMASWGMNRRSIGGANRLWLWGRFCLDCKCDTVKGYRAMGRCWPCYMAMKREEERRRAK
jgi:hypothetical protein